MLVQLLVLELSNCVLGCCGVHGGRHATYRRVCAGILWVLGLDAIPIQPEMSSNVDKIKVYRHHCWSIIFKWHRHHCWLAWFYRGGDTTLTVVMPHDDADVEAAQTLSEWQGQGAPRGSAPDPCPNTLFDPPLLDGWAGRLG